MRSAVVARHLKRRGHELEFVSSGGRAFDYLSSLGLGKVHPVVGVNSVISDNQIQPFATLAKNLVAQTIASPFAHIGALLALKRPDVVISDFDPWSARYAGFQKIPILAIDNIHFMNRCDHPRGMISSGGLRDRQAASLMFPVVSGMVPGAERYMVTTFSPAPVRLPRTTLHLPILREELLGAEKTSGDHVVVYLNDKADASRVVGVLSGMSHRFRIYGVEGVAGDNVELLGFSSDGFLRDLASSKAVIGGAGFTLMTEAIYSKKPMLAIPFEGQFEQILNSNYLQGLGYGERGGQISRGAVERFLSRLDLYRARLEGLRHDGNVELLSSVDGWLRGKAS